MFTGLIEHLGRVAELAPMAGGFRLTITAPVSASLQLGDSIAVNGVCLTVVDKADDRFAADLGPETARVTTLGSLTSGQTVNLERPMRPDGHMGGHFVLGHVDTTGRVTEVRHDGEFVWYRIAFDPGLKAYFIPKGSVAVDGISLTVATLYDAEFDVQIIPFTLDHTNLQQVKPGDAVNLEFDVIGKYVVRVAELAGMRPTGGVSI